MSRTRAASKAIQLELVTLGIFAVPILTFGATTALLPSWPQNFYVNAMERDGFGLPVTAAGAITVSVHAQGAPIVVVLTRPDGSLATQVVGTGDLRMSYGATPVEVAVSPLWHIGIQLQQPALGTEAGGSVQVQEPPIDARALTAFLSKPKSPPRRPDAAMAAQHQARIDAAKRAFEQGRAAHQAALLEAIRPRLEAAKARAGQQVSTRSVPPLTNVVRSSSTTMLAIPPIQRIGPQLKLPPPPPPPPVISLPLFIDHGEPGDPISIGGAAFGATQGSGTVHFVLGTTPWTGSSPGDVVAPVNTWTDTEIFTSVPTVVGYSLPTVVGLYVVRNDGTPSTQVPFIFYPTMDLQIYPVPPQTAADSVIPGYDAGWCQHLASYSSQNPYPVNGWAYAPISGTTIIGGFAPPYTYAWVPCDGSGGVVTGYKSNDIFFGTAQLKNGWVLDHVDLTWYALPGDFGSGAYVSTADPPIPGSTSLRVDVRVWADASLGGNNNPIYGVDVYVRGGKGVPFQ